MKPEKNKIRLSKIFSRDSNGEIYYKYNIDYHNGWEWRLEYSSEDFDDASEVYENMVALEEELPEDEILDIY